MVGVFGFRFKKTTDALKVIDIQALAGGDKPRPYTKKQVEGIGCRVEGA